MNTVSRKAGHTFSRVPSINIPRSKFDLSHGHKTTLDGGFLYPVLITEALVGDSIKCNLTQLCRMTTPIVPFMDNVKISYFFFSIPKRLLWENFEDYITGSHKGKVGTTHTLVPQLTITREMWDADPIYDHFGIPRPAVGGSFSVSALPFRAYQLCYSEWFRDQNLIDPIDVNMSDLEITPEQWKDKYGSDVPYKPYQLLRRCKRHDYATSCLPFVQKGPDVQLPLGFQAPVIGNGTTLGLTDGTNFVGLKRDSSNAASLASATTNYGQAVGSAGVQGSSLTYKSLGVTTDPTKSGLVADLSEATAATINSLREAFACQHLFERDARGGTRLCEYLEAHFGVRAPDFRLQRPEYLGGGNITFMVNSIAQTSASSDTPQGNLAAVSKAVGECGFQASFVEPCYILGLACITCDLFYQSALNRMWVKKNRTDEFWPEFMHLGEQAVLEHEVFADGTATDQRVFGYQERYAEYRYQPNLITGKLRSSDPQSLDVWHLAQDFAEAPSLSKEFIEEHPPFERVLAVQDEPQFVLDCWFDMKAIRPLATFSVPSLLDHF